MGLFDSAIKTIAINQILNGNLLYCMTVPLFKLTLDLHLRHWYCFLDSIQKKSELSQDLQIMGELSFDFLKNVID
jgi:hypothetical protein